MSTGLDATKDAGPVRRPAVDDGSYRPDMLLIGATERNAGKTELACRLIRRHASASPLVGLKVTTVERADGHCPHGRTECGVCSSLTRPWIVSREVDGTSPTDTSRLLASGAGRVYWLRVLGSELRGGAADLLNHVPPGWVGVCESTSLRQVVEPGLFLLVRAPGSRPAKRSARAVAHLADGVVVSDGRSFGLDLDRISVVDGQWALRREACAIVIDGGGDGVDSEHAAALRRTHASLERQFARVVAGAGTVARSTLSGSASTLTDAPDAWCLVTPPLAAGVPPGLVNAMFRRRVGVDVVLAVSRPHGRDVRLALCRRGLLPEVVATLGRGAALDDRYAVRELRLEAEGPGAGPGRLREITPRAEASPPTSCRGAEVS